MAATLTNSVYDDEENTISIGSESGGGGFAFGGELDATAQQTTQIAEFDVLDNCTVVGSVFTPTPASPIGSAMATHIARGDVGTQIFRFTWPTDYAPGDLFIVGFCTPSTETDIQNIFSGATTGMVGIGYAGGNIIETHKYGNEAPSLDAVPNSISANDIVRIEFRPDANIVSITNETTVNTLAIFDLGNYAEFSNSLSLFIYSAVPLAFAQDNTSPVLQAFFSIVTPTDANGKTYLVTAATKNSIVDGKLLKTNDFVTFYEDEGLKCVVNRLMSDADIQTIVTAMLNEPNITPLELVNPVADGVTTVMLENAIEINIVVNGEYDPPPQFNFNLDDTCFTQGRLVRIRLNTAIAIPFFSIAHYNYYGESVILESIIADTSWVFVFEKRGAYAELIAKYQV